jgi:hypothetical protein
MKTFMSTSLALVLVAFSLQAFNAFAQSTEASPATVTPSDKAKNTSDKAKKAADFATQEKAMQEASRSSASGAVASKPMTEATPYNKNKDKGKAAADQASDIQTFKGSKPVDKNAKAVAPMKSLSKMTPEERAELRKEVVKESKP